MVGPLAQRGQQAVIGRPGGQRQLVRLQEIPNRALENPGLLLPVPQLISKPVQVRFGGRLPVQQARNFPLRGDDGLAGLLVFFAQLGQLFIKHGQAAAGSHGRSLLIVCRFQQRAHGGGVGRLGGRGHQRGCEAGGLLAGGFGGGGGFLAQLLALALLGLVAGEGRGGLAQLLVERGQGLLLPGHAQLLGIGFGRKISGKGVFQRAAQRAGLAGLQVLAVGS